MGRVWRSVAGVGLLALAAIAASHQARQTGEVQGTVERTWVHTVDLQEFSPRTARGWRRTLEERPATMPIDGTGEDPGVEDVRDCVERRDGTRRVADGTEQVCTERTHQVREGTRTVCEPHDQGDGRTEEVCVEVPTWRPETIEDCVERTRYREEPVYGTWCTYDTWTWKTLDRLALRGAFDEPAWPEVEVGERQRAVRSASYAVRVSYVWEERTEVHEIVPTDLADFLLWTAAPVTLVIDRLGEVQETRQ